MSLRATTLGDRRLRLHVPGGEAPGAGWPLLVLLDGDWVWPLEPPPESLSRCAVLLPGHGPEAQARERRALDFTPPAPDGGCWPDPRQPAWQCGGAPAFLDELLGPMLRWARGEAPLDPARANLYGHSYGGLFALYALRHQPDAFTRIVCASPSLWWRDGFMTRQMAGLRAHPPTRPTQLVVIAGGDEAWHPRPASADAPDGRQGGIPTLPARRALVDGLQGIPCLTARLEVLPGLGHGPALRASARRAVDLAAQDAA